MQSGEIVKSKDKRFYMLIGITGTDGSGKGSAVAYMVSKRGFTHYSSRDLITLEVNKLGLPATRENLRLTANSMRATEGTDVIVKYALRQIKENEVEDAVVESIRAIKEVETFKKAGGILLTIDASPEIRYNRIKGRGSSSDKVSFEDFIKQENLEMNDPDPSGMQKATVIKMADYTIMNNQPLSKLYAEVDRFLSSYGF
jgi:dephospho-CoA kinase